MPEPTIVLLVTGYEVYTVPKVELELWLKFLRLEEDYSTADVPHDDNGNVFEWFNLLYTSDGNMLSIDEIKWYVDSEAMLSDEDMKLPTYEQRHHGDHVGNLTILSLGRLDDLRAETKV